MTTLQTVLCIFGTLSSWASIGLVVWLLPETHKRIVFLEESRMAMLASMAKHLKLTMKTMAKQETETGSKET